MVLANRPIAAYLLRMPDVSISGVIITYNEERTIARCIDSMVDVVDEIVVVDSYSSDATKAICLSKGVRFVEHAFEGYGEQKNVALAHAAHDIVLSLDADEALSDALKVSIRKARASWGSDGYLMNRLTSYCGKWIRHCGWYPGRIVRLWDRRCGRWGGGSLHARVVMDPNATVQGLSGDILHYSFPTIQSHLDTIGRFSEIAAREAHQSGKRAGVVVHVVLNPLYTFFSKYVLRLGFLDGYYGLVVCTFSAVANFAKYTKLRALNRGAGDS